MSGDVLAVIGVVIFVHIAATLVGLSIAKRKFLLFGGNGFGRHAHQVGVILFISACLMLYAANVVFSALPETVKSLAFVSYVYYGSLLLCVLGLFSGMVKEFVTRFAELGLSGFSLRLLASFMTSVVIAYVFFQLGLSGEITEVQVASLFGVSLALSLQVG